MRLIDADAFAKRAYEVAYPIVHGLNDHERGLTLIGIAQLLDEQPTVTENCWIPVTERLPEENARYLVTNSQWGYFEISINAWIDGEWLFPEEDPTAWMPLPEPWEEEE